MKTKLYLIFLMFLSLFLNCFGITSRLPNKKQNNLIFRDEQQIIDLSPVMESTREEIYEQYDKQSVPGLLKVYFRDGEEKIRIPVNGQEKEISKRRIDALRSYLMQSQIPDEQNTLRALMNINPAEREFNPHFFQYGGMYIYPIGATLKLASIIKLLPLSSDVKYYFQHPEAVQKIFVIPKLVGGILVTVSVLVIFFLASKLFGTGAGLLAATFFAITPLMMYESHLFKPYAYFVPFMLFSIYFAYKIIESGNLKFYILSSMFAGLAAGCLALAAVLILSVIGAHWLSEHRKRLINIKILLAIMIFILTIIVCNPYSVLAFEEFSAEYTHLLNQAPFAPSIFKFVHYIFVEFPNAFGYPLWALVICGIVYSLVKRTKSDLVVLFSLIPFLIYTSAAHWNSVHYGVILVVLSLILAGRFIAVVWQKVSLRWVTGTIIGLCCLYTLMNTLYYNMIFAYGDNRLRAGEWINTNIVPGKKIGSRDFLSSGVYGYPPFRFFDYEIVDGYDEEILTEKVQRLEKDKPDYYIALGNNEDVTQNEIFSKMYKYRIQFKRDFGVLDMMFRNHFLYYIDWKVTVYERAV